MSHQPERLQSGESRNRRPIALCTGTVSRRSSGRARVLGSVTGFGEGHLVRDRKLDTAEPISYRDVTLAVADGGAEATNRVDISRAHQRLDSDGRLSGDGCLEADRLQLPDPLLAEGRVEVGPEAAYLVAAVDR